MEMHPVSGRCARGLRVLFRAAKVTSHAEMVIPALPVRDRYDRRL